MADDFDDDGLDDGEEAEAGGGLKKLLLFVGAPVILLIVGVVVAYFLGVFDSLFGSAPEESVVEEQQVDSPGHFFELEEMLVSMGQAGRRSSFLKLRISLELEKKEDEQRIIAVMPRIIDNFQMFLRGLRIEELQGSHGLYRIKEELLVRVNAAANPVKIKDVLFKEMLVQ
ncbi:MAG: flagellar basal body-associated FliL family protein [Pseudomonadota bacterium]|nr:flagellar basal body-associated FliL family protein [Pseudomonadota bacterium]